MDRLAPNLAVTIGHLRVLATPTTPESFSVANGFLSQQLVEARTNHGLLQIGRALLADPTSSDQARHYSLQLINSAVSSAASDVGSSATASSDTLTSLKAAVVDLLHHGSRGVVSEALFVKEKIAEIVAGMGERLWPQRWPTMMPELLTAASSRDASLELVALSLRTLALDASNVDFSSHLPAVRRSEILQGLSASFAQFLPPFLSQLQRCVGAIASAVAGAQPPPFQTNDLTPTSAAILASAILELCAALASFLPPAAVRDMQMFSAVAAVWSSTSAASSAFALEPSMPTGLTVAPPSRVLSQPLLDRLHRSVVSCLDALAGRKFEAGNDPDLAIASLECAAGVIASSASLGHTPLSQPGDAASPPTVHVGYPTWRSLVAACADVYTRHMPVALSSEVMAGSASSLRPTPTSAIACVQRFAQQLVHLLRHPSVIVRCSVLGCVSESLTSTHFNAHMPPAFTAGFRGAVAPLVVGCCEREGRFCRVPDGAIPPLTTGRTQSQGVAGSGVAISRAAATDAAALHLRLQHAVRSDDFADDDVDEYGYAFDVMRARASKCMVDVMAAAAGANGNTSSSADAAMCSPAAVDQVCGDMAAVLLQAVQHGCSLATATSSPPSTEAQQYMSCYGTYTCASSPYRWLDATAHALDIVIAAMPQHALGPGKPAAQHLTAACGHLIQCGTEDPLLRTRVSVCIAHFGRVIGCDPGAASSLLSPMLERLFSFIECQPSPAATAAASAVGPAASQQLQLDVQYCRQRACHALVALAKAIPSALLPALQPLSQRAVSLISSGLLTGSDAVSLYELLILVSNALGASDPTAQASFLGDVLRHAVSGLTDPSLAAAVASPASLLAWLGLLPPYPSSPAEILAKCDALLHVLHVLWAVARRCTAQEYSHAVGGAGITAPRGVTSTSQSHASSASIGAAGHASSQHQRQQHQQWCVDDLDLPTHPFASNWGTILSVVLPLVRTLHELWSPGVIQHTMLAQPSATASSAAAAGSAAHDVQLASCHLLSLSKEESLALLQAGRREAATATGSGGGRGRKHGGDDEDDGDADDDDAISANGGAGAAGAAATFPVPVWSASTGRVVTAELPMTPASLGLAGKLTAWVSRVSWHAYSLVSMSASSHLMRRTHACALTPTTTTNAALAVNYGSGGGIGPAPSEADVAAAWSRTGLYSAAVAPSAWPVLQAALSMDVLQHVPLRIHRVLLQQLVPGLVQGCPPSQAAASELGSLLAPLLTCAIDALLRTAPGQPTAGAGLLATTGLDLHFGHLLPSSSSPLPSVTSSSNDREALCDKIRRDVTRSLMDVCLAILPPSEDWYGAVVSQGSSGAGSMPGHQHHVAGAAGMLASFLPSESPASSATDGATTGQQQQHQHGFVSLPGGIKLMTTSSSSTSGADPVSLPVFANGVLLLSPAAPCIAKVAATCLLHQDGMTARKGSMMWQRVLPCLPGWLHALAGAPSSSEAAPQMQVGIKLWCCAASAFCTESVRVMCTGRSNSGTASGASGGVGGKGKSSSSSTSTTTAAFVGPIENELTAIITDIYCLAAFGCPSSHINVAARPSSLSTSPRQMQAGGQAVPPPPSQPPAPLGLCMSPSGQAQGRALLSLACPDPRAVLASIISSGGGSHGGSSTGALDARLSNASSERERRGFMREALQEAAQMLSSRGANGTMSGGGDAGATAAMAGAASGRPVSNLPDRLTLIGRGASHGRGSSTVIESHALLDQPDYHGGGGGLEALFGDQGW